MFLTSVWSRVKVFLPPSGKVSSRKQFLCGLVVLGLFFGVAGQAQCQFLYDSVGADGGDTPHAEAVGDFNCDGIPDLAVANYSSRSVSVLLGGV